MGGTVGRLCEEESPLELPPGPPWFIAWDGVPRTVVLVVSGAAMVFWSSVEETNR